MANQGGSSGLGFMPATSEQQMEAFDRLPREVRRVLWDRSVDFSALDLHKRLRQGTSVEILFYLLEISEEAHTRGAPLHTAAGATVVRYESARRRR